MKSYPSFQQVCDDLGDKVLHAIRVAADNARADLTTYRQTFPSWVAQASERGLAAWIHDRLWYHFTVLMDGLEDINIRDNEPTREIFVRTKYRMRVKRHHGDGAISSYPTSGFLEFVDQPAQISIEGLEEVKLIAGYDWDRDARDMNPAVPSLRDGKDNVIWCEPVSPAEIEDDTGVTRPVQSGPSKTTVDTSRVRPDAEEDVAE